MQWALIYLRCYLVSWLWIVGKTNIDISIQFNCTCIAPNHNKHYLKALYIEGKDLKMYRETQQFLEWAALWHFNSLINRKKPLVEPESMWAAICLDRLWWTGNDGEERGGGWQTGERREREEREKGGTRNSIRFQLWPVLMKTIRV